MNAAKVVDILVVVGAVITSSLALYFYLSDRVGDMVEPQVSGSGKFSTIPYERALTVESEDPFQYGFYEIESKLEV